MDQTRTHLPLDRDPDAVFAAVLTAHRSLSRGGFVILMSGISFVSFVSGLVFVLMGAWPVGGFFGLDVLLIYLAFRLNYRAGRAYELVEITPDELRITRVSPSGKKEKLAVNAYWARVVLEQRGGRTPILKLISRGREIVFGACLNEEEKREFAEALKEGLARAKGPRI